MTLWKDIERTKRELLDISPEDEHEINKFIKHVNYATCCTMPVKKPMDMMNLFDFIEVGKAILSKYGYRIF